MTITEVGPRDGLQNLSRTLPTDDKVALIAGLAAAGLREMEATSFVRAKWIPQLHDAEEVVDRSLALGLEPMALVPNRKGRQRALAFEGCGLSYVLSATDSHNRANLNSTTEESVAELVALHAEDPPERAARVSISVAFGCPFEGRVDQGRIADLVGVLATHGFDRIVLCDTIGCADPAQVFSLCEHLQHHFPNTRFEMHLHDTRGFALANVLAALQAGITRFDASIAGLGGCPYAPGATGNLATEDLVEMLEACGVATGVDLSRLMDVVDLAANLTGQKPESAAWRRHDSRRDAPQANHRIGAME